MFEKLKKSVQSGEKLQECLIDYYNHEDQRINIGELRIMSCYLNSITLAKHLEAEYVVGLLDIGYINKSMIHGWVEFEGKIIDPCWDTFRTKSDKEKANLSYRKLKSIPHSKIPEYISKSDLTSGLDSFYGPWVLLGQRRIRDIFKSNNMTMTFKKYLKT